MLATAELNNWSGYRLETEEYMLEYSTYIAPIRQMLKDNIRWIIT